MSYISKRGQGLSTSAIILIVLGVLVLVLLILAFTGVIGDLKEQINKDSNVDTINNACKVACTTQSSYEFCEQPRILKIKGQKGIPGTCDSFSKDAVYKEYIKGCPDIPICNPPQ